MILEQIDKDLLKMAEESDVVLKDIYKKIDDVCLYNSDRILAAFIENHVSYSDFADINGYGNYDEGRDKIERIFATVLGCEDALDRKSVVQGKSVDLGGRRIIKKIREVNKDVIIMVDNCYGELVEKLEPGHIGADVVVGSLMKNLGGGIASTGGYVAGNKELINMVAERLTAPGIGKDLGANFNLNNSFFKGIFMAPNAVKSALKTAVFTAYMLEKLGYKNVSPAYNDERTDIIQTLELGSKENLVSFTQGIQSTSPIDSFVRVMAAPMPGYPFDEVMAAGSFTQGSTIELSADATVVEPYTLYMQGGLTLEYGKLSILLALTNMKNN